MVVNGHFCFCALRGPSTLCEKALAMAALLQNVRLIDIFKE
jgi:hypothetical protein